MLLLSLFFIPKLKDREVTCFQSQKKWQSQNLNLGSLTFENKRAHVPERLEEISGLSFEYLKQRKLVPVV